MQGLVLEGGGAKGAYHIGVYEALQELGFEFDGVAGTSIGALNGAMIAQGDFERARDLWGQLRPDELFQLDGDKLEEIMSMELDKDNLGYMLGKIRDIIKNRGIEVEGIKKTIEENIDEDKLRRSSMDFAMVTFSLSDMKPLELFLEDIPEGKVADYLLASSYLPAFKMEKMDDRYFLDGGFYDNLPINLLLGRDYERIIAVRTFSRGRIRPVSESGVEIEYIQPCEDLGRVLEFTPERIDYNIKLGYYDTHRHFRGLLGRNYYIEPAAAGAGAEQPGPGEIDEHDELYEPEDLCEKRDLDEKFFLYCFLEIPDENIEEAAELLGDFDKPPLRILLEILIPRLQELLDLEDEAGYDEIFISALELLAHELELERFKFYDFDGFWQEIAAGFEPELKEKGGGGGRRLPSFLKRSEFLSFTFREDLASQLTAILFAPLLKKFEDPQKKL